MCWDSLAMHRIMFPVFTASVKKTAIPLVQKYKSIENIYEHLNEIPQKGLRYKLETNREMAFLSKKLVTIDINVPLKISFNDLRASNRNIAKLAELFDMLEFRSLRVKLNSETEETPIPASKR